MRWEVPASRAAGQLAVNCLFLLRRRGGAAVLDAPQVYAANASGTFVYLAADEDAPRPIGVLLTACTICELLHQAQIPQPAVISALHMCHSPSSSWSTELEKTWCRYE